MSREMTVTRTLGVVVVFGLVGGLPVGRAQEGALFVAVEPSRTGAPGTTARQERSIEPSGGTGAYRLVRIDYDRLASAFADASVGGTPTLTLNLFDDVVFLAVVDHTAPTSAGYSLSGHLAGVPGGSTTLVVNGKIVVGAVWTPTATYVIDSTGGGVHTIRRSDPSPLPPLGDDILVGPATPSTSVTEDMTEDGSRIDVLVVYTSNGRSELGSRERIEVRIDFSVAQTNMAYTNSGVHQRIHLVQAVEVDYVSDGYTNTDVTRLEDPDDGFMDSIHALRDRYSADLVHLLVPVTDAHGRRGKFDVGGRALLGPSPALYPQIVLDKQECLS